MRSDGCPKAGAAFACTGPRQRMNTADRLRRARPNRCIFRNRQSAGIAVRAMGGQALPPRFLKEKMAERRKHNQRLNRQFALEGPIPAAFTRSERLPLAAAHPRFPYAVPHLRITFADFFALKRFGSGQRSATPPLRQIRRKENSLPLCFEVCIACNALSAGFPPKLAEVPSKL